MKMAWNKWDWRVKDIELKLAKFIGIAGHDVIGLDVGSDWVKAAQLQKKAGRYHLTHAACVPIEAGTDGDEDAADHTVAAIRRCVDSAGFKTSRAVCAVDGRRAAVRSFRFPAMPREEIGYAVLQEAEQVSGLDIQQSVVDYQIMGKPTNTQSACGTLVAVGAEVIESRRKLACDAGLQNVLMDVDSLAILNCFFEFAEPISNETIAIIDIESDYTNLIITHDAELPFVRNLPQGGAEIVREIAAKQQIPEENVGEVLWGKVSDYSYTEAVWALFQEAIEKLADEMAETFRYYASREHKRRVDKACVCGDFALVEGIEGYLQKKLSVDVSLWNPLAGEHLDVEIPDSEALVRRGPQMATALGLAMRTI